MNFKLDSGDGLRGSLRGSAERSGCCDALLLRIPVACVLAVVLDGPADFVISVAAVNLQPFTPEPLWWSKPEHSWQPGARFPQ